MVYANGGECKIRLFDVVIFGFDGVLADTRPPQIDAWQKICGEMGVLPLGDRWIHHLMGYGDHHVARAICGRLRATSNALEKEVVQRKQQMCDSLKVLQKEGAGNLLMALDQMGITTAVVTPRKGDSVMMLLQNWGFDRSLTYLLGSNYVGPEAGVSPAPAPTPYITAMEILGVTTKSCIAVEDNLPCLLAATEAGTFSVGLAGTLTRQELEVGTPSVIDNLGKVIELMALSEVI